MKLENKLEALAQTWLNKARGLKNQASELRIQADRLDAEARVAHDASDAMKWQLKQWRESQKTGDGS